VTSNFKIQRWESKRYREWVSTLPCIRCGIEGISQPHHIKGIGHFSGAGRKADDFLCMPLCAPHNDRPGCHRDLHDKPELLPLQVRWTLLTLYKAIRDGILVEAN